MAARCSSPKTPIAIPPHPSHIPSPSPPAPPSPHPHPRSIPSAGRRGGEGPALGRGDGREGGWEGVHGAFPRRGGGRAASLAFLPLGLIVRPTKPPPVSPSPERGRALCPAEQGGCGSPRGALVVPKVGLEFPRVGGWVAALHKGLCRNSRILHPPAQRPPCPPLRSPPGPRCHPPGVPPASGTRSHSGLPGHGAARQCPPGIAARGRGSVPEVPRGSRCVPWPGGPGVCPGPGVPALPCPGSRCVPRCPGAHRRRAGSGRRTPGVGWVRACSKARRSRGGNFFFVCVYVVFQGCCLTLIRAWAAPCGSSARCSRPRANPAKQRVKN
ncbi:LOW QUALITY PROTEIN: collagen alpha-1(X) chain-like [Passer domesticus]|uniref:LOW QUALITY PROTEIN: collagen alpha-1(X) chain-like n=1 Tax=Passer domesticus TaxID=48849 RepID=UPI0030FDFBD8